MTATPMERTVTSNGIHKQFYGGLHQTQPEPFRATDALHRPYHSTLRGRSVYGGGAWWLVRQVLYTGILQLRHRQGWPCRDVCGRRRTAPGVLPPMPTTRGQSPSSARPILRSRMHSATLYIRRSSSCAWISVSVTARRNSCSSAIRTKLSPMSRSRARWC